jgi:hypothetical protein
MAGPIHYADADGINFTPVSEASPLPVTSGVAMGALDDAAWDGATGDPASMVALWKGMMAQLVAINANTVA